MSQRTAATISQSFATFEWDADLYDTLSAVSKLAAAMKNRANVIQIAYRLRRVAGKLDQLFKLIDDAMEGRIPNDLNVESNTPQRLRATADSFEQMYRAIEYTYEAMRRVGLTNNSLTAGTLKRIQGRSQDFLDLADWFEAMAQPQELDDIFKRAAKERERGAFIDLAQIE